MDGNATRVSLMSKGMFCLVRGSPGFWGSLGEYACLEEICQTDNSVAQ